MGEGWGLAVINSLTEFKSINENAKTLRDKITFLLGGTTNSKTGQQLDYFEYKTTNAGKQFYYLLAPLGFLPSFLSERQSLQGIIIIVIIVPKDFKLKLDIPKKCFILLP